MTPRLILTLATAGNFASVAVLVFGGPFEARIAAWLWISLALVLATLIPLVGIVGASGVKTDG